MTSDLPVIDSLEELFINNTPFLDTRAPTEYLSGSFPGAHNIPLLADEARAQVGVCYKNHGQEAAINLGNKLISGVVKDKKIKSWVEFIKKNPSGALYCFRGGLRSQITQRWIYQKTGISYPRIAGGYKKMRNFLLSVNDSVPHKARLIIIAGKTGCGKTRLLKKVPQKVDLEALANHRGSAFGAHLRQQPTQINFENSLAVEFLKLKNSNHIILEDEGPNIGKIRMPQELLKASQQADIILLRKSLSARVMMTVNDYVVNMLRKYTEAYGKNLGFSKFSRYFLQSLTRIKKRLGGVRYQDLKAKTVLALKYQKVHGSFEPFYEIIETLLVEYYDPMYEYQVNNKLERIIFTGDEAEVLTYIKNL